MIGNIRQLHCQYIIKVVLIVCKIPCYWEQKKQTNKQTRLTVDTNIVLERSYSFKFEKREGGGGGVYTQLVVRRRYPCYCYS